MGVWGSGLYQNDVAADVRQLFLDLSRLPGDAIALARLVEQAFPEASSPDDESYTDFCFVLADQFHQHGLDHEPVLQRARSLIASGEDLERRRSLGASDRDLRQRGRVLNEFLARLASPHPKPRRRKVLAAPEEWVFEEGALRVYPVRDGEPVNPHFPRRMLTDWVSNGWGGFVVLVRTRLMNCFAVYLIGIFKPPGPARPGIEMFTAGAEIPFAAALVTATPAHLKKMRVETAGRMELLSDQIEQEFVAGAPPFDFRPRELANALLLDTPEAGNPNTRPDMRRFLAAPGR